MESLVGVVGFCLGVGLEGGVDLDLDGWKVMEESEDASPENAFATTTHETVGVEEGDTDGGSIGIVGFR